MFGLRDSDILSIRKTFSEYPQVEKVVIFGSRVLGNYKNGSDVDLAIYGKSVHTFIHKLSFSLNEESLMPYKFDLVDFAIINNDDLINHIEIKGIQIC